MIRRRRNPPDGTASTQSRPVSVLQVLLLDAPGGTEIMVASLCEAIDRRRVETTLVTLDRPGPIVERVHEAGIRAVSLGGRGACVAIWRLAKLIATERFDVVNAYGF